MISSLLLSALSLLLHRFCFVGVVRLWILFVVVIYIIISSTTTTTTIHLGYFCNAAGFLSVSTTTRSNIPLFLFVSSSPPKISKITPSSLSNNRFRILLWKKQQSQKEVVTIISSTRSSYDISTNHADVSTQKSEKKYNFFRNGRSRRRRLFLSSSLLSNTYSSSLFSQQSKEQQSDSSSILLEESERDSNQLLVNIENENDDHDYPLYLREDDGEKRNEKSSSLTTSTTTTTTTTTSYDDNIDQNYDDDNDQKQKTNKKKKVIPITILSGFLGSGKTSLLQYILNDPNHKLRIAVIVNDVASINIDHKFLTSSTSISYNNNINNDYNDNNNNNSDNQITIMELQNGCACCSKSDDLLENIVHILTLNDLREEQQQFDHILIEMSGIADPNNIRNKFHEIEMYDDTYSLSERVSLDTMITLIDVTTYLKYMNSTKYISYNDTPELLNKKTTDNMYNSDYDDNNIDLNQIPYSLRKTLGLIDDNDDDDMDDTNSVTSLLTSQTEIADIIVLNKIDLLSDDATILNQIEQIVYALNPTAQIMKSIYGNISSSSSTLTSILGSMNGNGKASSSMIDDHRMIIQTHMNNSHNSNINKKVILPSDTSNIEDHHDDHDHTSIHQHTHHNHDHNNDDSHDDHTHSTTATTSCGATDCTDPTHDHSHMNQHHDDHHTHSTTTTASCESTDCTDPTHDHSHKNHNHHATTTTSTTTTNHANIGTYIYQARRPFHPQRLYDNVIRHLPIQTMNTLPVTNDDDNNIHKEHDHNEHNDILHSVIRSKGFIWLANSHQAAYYWSHSGINLDISCLGAWWATINDRTLWPHHSLSLILQDYDTINHYDNNTTNTIQTISVGDRRQELVFIGPNIGNIKHQQYINDLLNKCLLNDNEYMYYIQNRHYDDQNCIKELYTTFTSPFLNL